MEDDGKAGGDTREASRDDREAGGDDEHPYDWSDAKVRRALHTEFFFPRDRFEGARVLELSAGTNMTNAIDDVDRAVGVVDEREASRLPARARAGVAEWVVAERDRLPFPDDSFDIAVVISGLEHHARPAQVLEEVERVLVDGGTLLCEATAFDVPAVVRRRLGAVDGAHDSHLSPEEIRSLVTDTGFDVDERLVLGARTGESGLTPKLLVAKYLFRLRRTYLRATKRATKEGGTPARDQAAGDHRERDCGTSGIP